jgi:hypothetical protein
MAKRSPSASMSSLQLASILRTLIITSCSLTASLMIYKTYLASPKQLKKKLFLASLLPLIIPPLIPGYAYSAFKFNFQTSPWPNEILYALVLIGKNLPFGFITLYLLNYNPYSTAQACSQLSPKKAIPIKISQRAPICSFLFISLIIFHDYEIASIMRIPHWSTDVFNAHAGGLSRTLLSSLKMILVPLTYSLLSIAALFYFLKQSQLESLSGLNQISHPPKAFKGIIILALLLSIIFILPMIIIFHGAWGGFIEIFTTHWMLRETFNSIAFALVSTLACSLIIFAFLKHKLKKAFLCLLTLPGLCGNLILGLTILSLFQAYPLSLLKGTSLMLCCALILSCAPIAILLNLCYEKFLNKSALSSAALLPKTQKLKLMWNLKTFPLLLCQFPIFCSLWYDLTLNTLLAPSSMPGLFPRLYNLMHYNENEKLSATVIIAVLVPPIILLATLLISRIGIIWKKSTSSGN